MIRCGLRCVKQVSVDHVLFSHLLHEAGLSITYGPYGGLRWSLIFMILWIGHQHGWNFPAILPSCLELWVMCFKRWSGLKWLWAVSIVWTRPVRFVSLPAFPWRHGERARKSESWESVRRRSQTSGWSTSRRKISGAKSALSSLKGMLFVQHELSSIHSTSITTENTFDFLKVLYCFEILINALSLKSCHYGRTLRYKSWNAYLCTLFTPKWYIWVP